MTDTTIIGIYIIWHLVGCFSFLFFAYKANGFVVIADFLFAITIGGCYGFGILLIAGIARYGNDWLNKKIF